MEHGGDIYGNKNIELDFSVNLSPIGPPREVSGELLDGELQGLLTSYPDPMYRDLRRALSAKAEVPEDWILCGNGASELLMAVAQALRPKRAMIPVPSYQGYERVLEAVKTEPFFYQLKREQGFSLTEGILESDDGLKRLAEGGSKTEESGTAQSEAMLFLCNPNNPAGKCIEPELLNRIAEYCRENRIFLVVDECYLELVLDAGRRTMKRALAENPYLIIVSAFTKAYAMPGIRLGYLLTGNSDLLCEVRRQQPEWSVSMFAQRAGLAALRSEGYLTEARRAVITERNYVCWRLRELGMEVVDGEAPFVMFFSGRELYEPLKEKGILIRRCDGIRGVRSRPEESGHYYRVGLRSHEDNRRLMREIGELVRL